MHTRSEAPGDRVVVAVAGVFYVWAVFSLATPFMPGDVVLTTTTAVVGALGALVIAYINSFLKEQYVRHLDAAAIAAGLAGELSSYADAWPRIRATLVTYLEAVDSGKKGSDALSAV